MKDAETKKSEAVARQLRYNALSTGQKLQLHLSRVGSTEVGGDVVANGGKREFKRLSDKLHAENAAVVAKAEKRKK